MRRLRQRFGRFRRPAGTSPAQRSFPRRRAGHVLLAAVVGCLVGTAWIAVTALLARGELLAAQRALGTLRQSVAGGAPDTVPPAAGAPATDARTAMRSAAAHAARAHRLTTGPAWYLAEQVPFLGRPVGTVRGVACAADRLTNDVLQPMVGIAPGLAGDAREGGLRALLSALGGKAAALERAARAAEETRTKIGELPRSTWLTAADQARTQLARQLDRIVPAAADVAVAARVLPPMLGEQGPRRYFVVFQNTAEARGTGGMPGAFAVLIADGGRLRFETFGNDTVLADADPSVDLGGEYMARYQANDPTGTWANANMSPHFPYAARIWSAAWRQHSGERVDGVVAVDPGALVPLLRATGPGRLPNGTMLTADNVVDLSVRTGYERYPDLAERKAFFLDLARTAAGRLTDAIEHPSRITALLSATREVLGEERLKAWSARPREQRLLEQLPLSGVLPRSSDPFAGLVVNNAAGGKLDYYLERQLNWVPGPCTWNGRSVTARIVLANRAPAGLPFYVTQRVDAPSYRTRPGDNRLLVSYYASAGAQLTSATLDGRPITVAAEAERGHPVYTLDLELPAGKPRTLTLHLLEPPSDRPPMLLRQPLVRPLRTSVDPYPPCDG